MSTTFIGSQGGSFGGTTVTIPAHQAGDLIVMFVLYTGTLTPPAGWTLVGTGPYATAQTAIYYRFATSTSDTSGTWTGAALLANFTYRQAAPSTIPTASPANGNSATISFPELTGHSAYLRIAYPASGAAASGWTNRPTANVQGVDALAASGAASAVGGNTTTISSQDWVSWTVGLSVAPAGKPGAFFQFF
ncbi:hypothetical protein ACLQ3K_20185 [Tsukamurella sp. DT100]|uniref:hypothetical protein n=1 Tax=Tsukamurella sp. DT100 TaxID=3393415 RepID=UPI003CEA348F